MGRFSDLKHGSDKRLELWEKYKAQIKKLLEEVNEQVFDNRCSIVEDAVRATHSTHAEITKPNYLFSTKKDGKAFCISTYPGGVYLRVYLWVNLWTYQDLGAVQPDPELKNLEQSIRSCLTVISG